MENLLREARAHDDMARVCREAAYNLARTIRALTGKTPSALALPGAAARPRPPINIDPIMKTAVKMGLAAIAHTEQVNQKKSVKFSKVRSSDPLSVAAQKHGYSLRALARDPIVNRTVAGLIKYRDGKTPVPRVVRERIKELIGFDSWPRVSDE